MKQVKAISMTSVEANKTIVVVFKGFKLNTDWIPMLQALTVYKIKNRIVLDTPDDKVYVDSLDELISFIKDYKFSYVNKAYSSEKVLKDILYVPSCFGLKDIDKGLGYDTYFFKFNPIKGVRLNWKEFVEEYIGCRYYYKQAISIYGCPYISSNYIFELDDDKEFINVYFNRTISVNEYVIANK